MTRLKYTYITIMIYVEILILKILKINPILDNNKKDETFRFIKYENFKLGIYKIFQI